MLCANVSEEPVSTILDMEADSAETLVTYLPDYIKQQPRKPESSHHITFFQI